MPLRSVCVEDPLDKAPIVGRPEGRVYPYQANMGMRFAAPALWLGAIVSLSEGPRNRAETSPDAEDENHGHETATRSTDPRRRVLNDY